MGADCSSLVQVHCRFSLYRLFLCLSRNFDYLIDPHGSMDFQQWVVSWHLSSLECFLEDIWHLHSSSLSLSSFAFPRVRPPSPSYFPCFSSSSGSSPIIFYHIKFHFRGCLNFLFISHLSCHGGTSSLPCMFRPPVGERNVVRKWKIPFNSVLFAMQILKLSSLHDDGDSEQSEIRGKQDLVMVELRFSYSIYVRILLITCSLASR